jgi:hypothetical protein
MVGVYIVTNAKEVSDRLLLADEHLDGATKDISNDVGNRAFLDLIRTTTTWNHKVSWIRNKTSAGGLSVVEISTEDDVYKWIDEGTRPHYIIPKRATFLRFHSGYNAKTTPGILGAHGGGDHGPLVYRQIVFHPGNAPRNFTQTVMEKYAVLAPQLAEKHVKEWKARYA